MRFAYAGYAGFFASVICSQKRWVSLRSTHPAVLALAPLFGRELLRQAQPEAGIQTDIHYGPFVDRISYLRVPFLCFANIQRSSQIPSNAQTPTSTNALMTYAVPPAGKKIGLIAPAAKALSAHISQRTARAESLDMCTTFCHL
jgi:hypothetical protein